MSLISWYSIRCFGDIESSTLNTGVFVVLAFGSALGLSLSCCHAMGVVERANRNAKNVPVGNHSGV